MHTTDIEYCNPFNETAPDFWMKIEHLARYMYASALIREKGLKNAADIACADGYGCLELADSALKVIGVDISKEILEKAKLNAKNANKPNIEFLQCDLEKQELSSVINEPLSFIACFETLEHLENPYDTLVQYNKVLSKEGILLLSVPNEEFEPKDLDGKPRNPYHKQLFSKDAISRLLTDSGFRIKRYLYQPYTNIFFNKEKKMIDLGLHEKNWVNSLYKQDPVSVRFFASLFAWPEKRLGAESYSIIIEAIKSK